MKSKAIDISEITLQCQENLSITAGFELNPSKRTKKKFLSNVIIVVSS